jgi:thiaminase
MVSPGEWGPGAWELLHGLSERVGNQRHVALIRDERNELKLALRHFWALLPCLKCQKHYKEWIQANPPDKWIDTPFGIDLKESMREWVYRLHENVNQSREINSGLSLDSIKEIYSSVSLRERANELKGFYQRGLDARTLSAVTWKVAWKHLDMLLRLL